MQLAKTMHSLTLFFLGGGSGISIPKMFIIGKKVWPFFWRSYEDVSKSQVEKKSFNNALLKPYVTWSDHNSNDDKCWLQLRCFIFQLQGPVVFMSWCPVDPERPCVFHAWMCTSRLSQAKALQADEQINADWDRKAFSALKIWILWLGKNQKMLLFHKFHKFLPNIASFRLIFFERGQGKTKSKMLNFKVSWNSVLTLNKNQLSWNRCSSSMAVAPNCHISLSTVLWCYQ